MRSILKVLVREGGMGVVVREFEDWFDFADFAKQETLAGREVIIVSWFYERRGGVNES